MNAGGCRAVPRKKRAAWQPLARTVTLRPERLHMPDARGSAVLVGGPSALDDRADGSELSFCA